MSENIHSHMQGQLKNAEAKAAAVRVAAGVVTWFMKETRMKADAPQLNAQIEALHRSGARGFLIGRYIGRSPDAVGNEFQTYLGLAVAATGATKEEAVRNFHAAAKQATQKPPKPTQCTPDNPTGLAPRMHGELRALPDGYNFHYAKHVSGQVTRFLERNRNGNLGAEHIFVTYDEWLAIIADMSSTRWGDLVDSILGGRSG